MGVQIPKDEGLSFLPTRASQTWSSRDLSLGLKARFFTSLGLGLGLEPRSLGLGTLEFRSRSWDL